jgi:YbbR domain-containing protein
MNVSRKWPIFSFSLLFSCVLWVWTSLESEYQTFIKVKLETVNLPKGKAFINVPPTELNVKFSGSGHQLAKMYFNPNLKCELNLSVLDKNNYILLKKENLQNMIKMPYGVQALEVYPDSLFFALDDNIEKRVPVKPNIQVNCLDGYTVVGAVVINPNSVKITGPKGVLDKIDYWNTAYNKYKDIKENISSIFPLSDSLKNVIKLSPEMVWIDINVQMSAEEEYKNMSLTLENFPNNHNIIIIPSTVDVLVRSGVDILATFDQSQLKIAVDYKQIEKDSLGYLIPKVYIPEDLEVIKLTPPRLQYVIRR